MKPDDPEPCIPHNRGKRPLRLLAISEHYFPRVGGTVNYVHETLSALSRLGVKVELWVPGPAPECWLPDGLAELPYEVHWIDVGYPPKGEPTRRVRYAFCKQVNKRALERTANINAPDLLHVVFGLFVMEMLDTEKLRRKGLRTVATVHNVPPHECRVVASDAHFIARIKEDVRLQLVKRKNHARIRSHRYDAVVVPSDQVRDLLAPLLRDQDSDVIGHGPTEDLIKRMSPPVCRRQQSDGPVRFLTAGGYAPHKRQHLIPQIAARLRDTGLDFEWDVVGPSGRVEGYYDGVLRAVRDAGLEDIVRIHPAVLADELAALYDAAHLYIQPSTEEGFCITALDAASAGLPVIASPAGALAQIAKVSQGMLVESAPEPLSEAILEFVRGDRWGDTHVLRREVRARFSWETAAATLHARYLELLQKGTAVHA